MSTPANIAELDKKGRLHIINVDMDGYPEEAGAGNVLLNAYRDPKKVHQLIGLGNLAHVGFTPKQANAYKEAGDNWSSYTGVKDWFHGKGKEKQDRWFAEVDNFTHAFPRDLSRSHGEHGQKPVQVAGDSQATVGNAIAKMNSSSKFEAEHNYLYDDRSKTWYYNRPGSAKVHYLSNIVPKYDQYVLHGDYKKFKQNPVNPHLPKLNAEQIHGMIDKAINGPKDDPTYSLKSDLDYNEGTYKSNINSGDNNRHDNAEYLSGAKRDKAQIANLKQINNYVKKHPDTKLYPNDLNLSHHLGKTIGHSKALNHQRITADNFGKFLDTNPSYDKKLGMYSGKQAAKMLKNDISDLKKPSVQARLKKVGLSEDAVKVYVSNDKEKLKQISPARAYTAEEVNGSADTFQPLGKKSLAQNLHWLAPHDKKIHEAMHPTTHQKANHDVIKAFKSKSHDLDKSVNANERKHKQTIKEQRSRSNHQRSRDSHQRTAQGRRHRLSHGSNWAR